MNLYPDWWDSTLTVFNKFEDANTGLVTWYRNVIDGCFWKNTHNQQLQNQTVASTNAVVVRIPQKDNFKPFYEWNELPDKDNHFTLKQGDIIVLGNILENIDEYSSDMRSSNILTKYHGLCFSIEQFDVNVRNGVGLPHYYVSGK